MKDSAVIMINAFPWVVTLQAGSCLYTIVMTRNVAVEYLHYISSIKLLYHPSLTDLPSYKIN